MPNSIECNSYLISTNIQSFGYIISDTDDRMKEKLHASDSFFEIFQFDPDTAAKIFNTLRSNTSAAIFAKDINSNGFLFCQSVSTVGVFAFIKRIDINPDEAATIIREAFCNEIICLNCEYCACSEESYSEIYNMLSQIINRLSSKASSGIKIHDMLSSVTHIPIRISFDNADTSLQNAGPCEYVLCVQGFAVFLSFLCMTHEIAIIKIKSYNNYHIAYATIKADGIFQASILKKLDFLKNVMYSQNLNLFYSIKENEINIIFFPYYIDDGLLGVKAPINLEEI